MSAIARLKAVIEETSQIKANKEALAFENLLATLTTSRRQRSGLFRGC